MDTIYLLNRRKWAMLKTYRINVNLGVQMDASNIEEAKQQTYDFLQSVANSEDLTEDEN